MTQPVGPIPVQAPVPSILTTARDRSADDFGVRAPLSPAARDALPDSLAGDGVSRDSASWRSGISWPAYSCQPSYPYADCLDAGDQTIEDFAENGGPLTSSPFTIYTPLACDQAADAEGLGAAARNLTEAHTAFGLARALWTGEGLPDAVAQPTLRRTATEVTGVHDLEDAVALLLAEYELGTGGNGGAVLHVPSILITGAYQRRIIERQGNPFVTPLGALVSPGPGYPWGASVAGTDGMGPRTGGAEPNETYAGNAADEVWVYVTGPVEYALGAIQMRQLDYGQGLRMNREEVVVQRRAIFRFDDCGVWATRAHNFLTASTTEESS
jgi:hypothetical protein